MPPAPSHSAPHSITHATPHHRDASWPDISAEYDYSDELAEAAGFNICMTFFVSFVFAFGAFIFNQHAQKAILSPMKKLTDITKR